MAVEIDPYKLSSPRIYLVRMVVFLILVGFAALILYKQIALAFSRNPGLNSLIFFVLFIGIVLALRQVIRLFREVRWVNALPRGLENEVRQPILLGPIAMLIGGRPVSEVALPTLTLRAVLDSIGTRLDEARDTSRYLTGLLIFLGLLGTFWGLLTTVGSIGDILNSMQSNGDAAVMFDNLKSNLARPLSGMSISFTSSLFGLAGSLVLGFLDLQAGQAQNRFYNELEDNLTAKTAVDLPIEPASGDGSVPRDLRSAIEKIAATADQTHVRATSIAMANLADGIQSLVQHMRNEQQMIRDWVEAQATQNEEMKKVLKQIAREAEHG
ncbi:MAG: flagellar motor protein MotA [Methylovirgula sp.]|uniref:flagellar motor protein MotA n=1 Tax=Methylovirgula sp. TaxID=1978224 RepID=UPI0030762989